LLKVSTREIDGEKVRGIVLPDVDLDAIDFIPSAAYGAESELEDPNDSKSRVVDATVPEKRFVPFHRPGLRVETKALYTVKAIDPGGVLVQLPMEDQINNHVASPDDFVGLTGFIRQGFTVLYDLQKGKGLYCPTWGCWAEWNDSNQGFCTGVHLEITKPNRKVTGFSEGATTSQSVRGI